MHWLVALEQPDEPAKPNGTADSLDDECEATGFALGPGRPFPDFLCRINPSENLNLSSCERGGQGGRGGDKLRRYDGCPSTAYPIQRLFGR